MKKKTKKCAGAMLFPVERLEDVVVGSGGGGGGGVLTSTRIIKSVITGQAPVLLKLRNTPGKNTNQPKEVHIHITADAVHASARNIYKSEIGSQPTMCQVHTCAYVSLLVPGKTDYAACHPRETTTYTYTTRDTYHYAYARQTHVN